MAGEPRILHGGGGDVPESRITLSRRDCAETLYWWLSEHLTEHEVKEMAREVSCNLQGWWGMKRHRKRYDAFYGELFILHMFLIVMTCEGVIENTQVRNELLDLFHELVYERNVKVTGVRYNRWRALMNHMYEGYHRTMASTSLLTPLLLVAHEFEKNLCKQSTLTPYSKFEFSMHIGGVVKQLSELLQGYEIE